MIRKPYKHILKLSIALLLLRLISGGFMLNHGIPKLLKLMQGPPFEFADPIGLGVTASLWLTVFAEVICAACILIGLFTRLAAIPLIITMTVAAFIVHSHDAFLVKEMPLLYLAIYVAIIILGPGNISLDGYYRRKKV